MKTLKSNNFGQALKEVQSMDPEQANKVKEQVNHNERKYFHLLLVKIENRPGQAKNKVIINGSILSPEAFERLQKNSAFLGYAKVIIVHDPRLVEKEDDAPTLHLQEKMKIKEEAKKALAEKHAKELKEAEEQLAKEKLKEKGAKVDEKEDDGSDELDGLTVDELKAFAESKSIDLSGLKKKEDIKTAIETWLEEQQADPVQ